MSEPTGGEPDALGVAVSYTGGLSEAFLADVEGMRPAVGSLVEDLSRLKAASTGIEIDPLAGSVKGFESDVARILAGFAEIRRAQEQAAVQGAGALGGKTLDAQLQQFAKQQLSAASVRFESSSSGIPGSAEILRTLESAALALASAAGKQELALARENLRQEAVGADVVRQTIGANSNRLNTIRLDNGSATLPGGFASLAGQADRLTAAFTALTQWVKEANGRYRIGEQSEPGNPYPYPNRQVAPASSQQEAADRKQIEDQFGKIKAAIVKAFGDNPLADNFLSGLTAGIAEDVAHARADIAKVKAEAGKVLGEGGGELYNAKTNQPHSAETLFNEILYRLSGRLDNQIRMAGFAAPKEIGELDLGAVRRALEATFVSPLRQDARTSVREFELSGTDDQRSVFGQAARINGPLHSDLSTVAEEWQRKIGDYWKASDPFRHTPQRMDVRAVTDPGELLSRENEQLESRRRREEDFLRQHATPEDLEEEERERQRSAGPAHPDDDAPRTPRTPSAAEQEAYAHGPQPEDPEARIQRLARSYQQELRGFGAVSLEPWMRAQNPKSFSGLTAHVFGDVEDAPEILARIAKAVRQFGLGVDVATEHMQGRIWMQEDRGKKEDPNYVSPERGKAARIYFPDAETAPEALKALVEALKAYTKSGEVRGDEAASRNVGVRYEFGDQNPDKPVGSKDFKELYAAADEASENAVRRARELANAVGANHPLPPPTPPTPPTPPPGDNDFREPEPPGRDIVPSGRDLRPAGGAGGGSQPPRPPAPGDGDFREPEDDDFADRIVPPTPSAEEIRAQRAAKLKELQQQWADYLETAFELPPEHRPQPFGNVGFDPLRDLGERAFHINRLNEAGTDFDTAHPVDQAIYEQKSALRLLQDLVKAGDQYVVPTKDYYVDFRHDAQQPDVYTKQAGSRVSPASEDEFARAMRQAGRSMLTQPGKFSELLALEGPAQDAARAEADRIAELNGKYEELYRQNLAKRLTAKVGYDPALPVGQKAFHSETFEPLQGVEQEYYSRRGFNWELQKRLDEGDPTLQRVGRNVVRDTSAGDGRDAVFYFRQAGEALIASTDQVRAALAANKAAIEGATKAADREALLRYQAAAAEEEAARSGAFRPAAGPAGPQSLLDYFKSGFLGTYGHGGGNRNGGGGGGGGEDDGGNGRSGTFNALAELTQQGGMAVKYSLLYGTAYRLMSLLPDLARDVVNTDAAITDLNLAFDGTTQASTGLINSLENVAAVTGINVADAVNVATQGVRAFRDEVGNTGPAMHQLAIDFTDQANQISVITGSAIADAGKFQTAIASGFNLPKNQIGFSQITDAIAGAHDITGGDSGEIMKGLGGGAVDFRQLGFTMNQAAILVGKINAMTGESGDTAVQRLSRIGEILGSQTGRNYITTTLNPSLAPEDRIKTSGTPAEQLIKLAKIMPTLNPAQQNAAASALGGPQGQKEFLATMQSAKDIGDQILPGKGADEFETKVNSIAGTLREILGNVRAFIQNLATSGLADPIIFLLDYGIKPLTAALKYVTQAFDTLTGLMPQWAQTLAFGIPELLVALKGIQALKGNGGVGGALRGVERVVRPADAEARARLEGRAPEVEGAERNPLQRVPVTLTNTETAATRALGTAAAAVEADSAELMRIQRALDAQQIRQSRTRTDFIQDNPNDEAGLAALDAQHAQNREALQKRLNDQQAQVVTSTVDQNRAASVVATEQGRYADAATAKASAVDSAREAFAQQVDDLREKMGGLADGSAERNALEEQEVEARRAFIAALREIDAQELAAREAAVVEQGAAAAAGGLGSKLKGFAGGVVGGLGGLGVGLVVTAALTAVVDGIGAIKDTSDKLGVAIDQARGNERAKVGVQGSQYAANAAGFRQLAQNDASAAEAIRRNRTGVFGALAANFNPSAERDQHLNEQLSQYDLAQANKLQELQDAQARTLGSGVPGAIDLSGADDVATSLKNLSDQGYSAAHIVDAITASLKQLSFVSNPLSNKLTQVQIGGLAAGAGRAAAGSLQTTYSDVKALQDVIQQYKAETGKNNPTDAELKAFLSGQGGFAAPTVQQFLKDNPGVDPMLAAHGTTAAIGTLNAADVGNLVANTTTSFLNDPKYAGKDLTASSTMDAYKKVLEASLQQAQIPPAVAANIANTAAAQFQAQVANLKTFFSDPKNVQNLISNGAAYLQQNQQDVANQTKVANAAKGGVTVDDSAVKGLQSNAANLAAWRAAVEAGHQSGAISDDDYPRLVGMITQQQTKNQADTIEALKQQAQQQIAFNSKVRQARQRAATSSAEVLRIGASSFTNKEGTGDADVAIKSGDIDLITQVFNGATRAQVKALQDTYANALKTAKGKRDADVAVAKKAHEVVRALKALGPAFAGELSSAEASAAAADAIVATDNAAVGTATTNSNNVNTAAGASNPTGTATEGIDANGGTQAQIAAQNEAAKATKNRDSLGGLKAALDKAKADAAVPGLNAAARAQAADALAAAQNAYDDGVRAQTAAMAKAKLYPGDKLGIAKVNLDTARDNLNVYAKGSKEWAEAQIAFTDAQIAYDDVIRENYLRNLKLHSDLTDPIAQAAIELKGARKKLADDRKNHADKGTLGDDQLDVEGKENSQEAAIHNRTTSHLKDLESAQQISHAQYLQGLQAEEGRIREKLRHVKKGSNMWTQLNDELLNTIADEKAASDQMQGQFNLGDIRVPTVYEVRRSIAAQTSGAAAVSNHSVNNTTTVNLSGVETDRVLTEIQRIAKAMGMKLYTNAARKV